MILMYCSVCDGEYSCPIYQNVLFGNDIRQMKPNSFFVYVLVSKYFENKRPIKVVCLRKYNDRML
jgi:hypothetical protein